MGRRPIGATAFRCTRPATADAPWQIDDGRTWRAAASATPSVARSATARPATGKGITSKYGLNGAANYHDRPAARQHADGEIFNTITNGKGQMIGYGYNITIDDRWRIVMYIRALQRSQNAALARRLARRAAEAAKPRKRSRAGSRDASGLPRRGADTLYVSHATTFTGGLMAISPGDMNSSILSFFRLRHPELVEGSDAGFRCMRLERSR